MTIPKLAAFLMALGGLSLPALAAETHDHADHETIPLFHAFTLEADRSDSRAGTLATWDLDGWYGGDTHRLWVKSEGESVNGGNVQAENWLMYGRNIATFWDAQAGLRHDTGGRTYAVFGVQGLAPYYFETEAHGFVSDKGKVSARLREEIDLLLTQQLILRPHGEVNVFAQDVGEDAKGAGVSSVEAGVQTRYEITRSFAPYVDVNYLRLTGETAGRAHALGNPADDFTLRAGVRMRF